MQKVIDTNGVFNFVCWLGKPAVIKDDEIELIRNFLNDHMNVILEKVDVGINDIVRIKNGAFMQTEGRIMAVSGKKVKIFLPTLGYAMVAEVGKTNFELVKKAEK
jgi:transcription antitermination factor NusG